MDLDAKDFFPKIDKIWTFCDFCRLLSVDNTASKDKHLSLFLFFFNIAPVWAVSTKVQC